MKTMTERDGDLPKTMAIIMSMAPALVFRTGVAYLRTRRRAHQTAQFVFKGMVSNGVPPETARRLADQYADDLSIRRIIRTASANRTK